MTTNDEDSGVREDAREPVEPGSARWHELIAEAIRRDAHRNWFLGDAALEIEPMSHRQGGHARQDALARFAAETGIALETLRNYRATASAWPPASRVEGVSYSVHQRLTPRPHLIRPGMTYSQAQAELEAAVVAEAAARGAATRAAAAARTDEPGEPGGLLSPNLDVLGRVVVLLDGARSKTLEIVRILQEQGEHLDAGDLEAICAGGMELRNNSEAIMSLAGGEVQLTAEDIDRLLGGAS